MKLNDVKPNIETSGELEEQFFSIQDQGMIFDILRNKMYSNPILAICREISCNARDAHREVGTPEVPVHVYLPNSLEPFFKIKDFGPGISPDRMSNIFIKYTASTKRNDNIQTGGFGLGAKTPFSYSDTFSIITNYNGVKYNYSCFIDETKVGKLALFSESPTDEPNGTEIIVPVKPADFNSFRDSSERSMRHWKTLPVVKGGNINWNIPKTLLQGNNWFIAEESGNYNYNYRYDSHGCKLIIDGIEYPIDLESLRKYSDTKIIDSIRGTLFLHFNVGELSLSASREQVYLDKPTQVKISQRIKEVTEQIIKISNDKIEAFPDLWQANIYCRKELTDIFSNLNILGLLSWKGVPLSTSSHSLPTECTVYSFTKSKPSRRSFTSANNPPKEKISRHLQKYIAFDINSVLYINDLSIKEPTPRHVKKAFEQDPSITSVQVICPNDKMDIKMIYDTYHVDLMGSKLISTITNATARKYTPSSSRLLVFRYDPLSAVFRQVSFSSIEEDKNKDKVLCKLVRDLATNFRKIRLNNKTELANNTLKYISEKYPNHSFYGIDDGALSADDERLEEDFGEFEDIDEFLEKEIVNSNINFVEVKFARLNRHALDVRPEKVMSKLENLIKDKNSLYLKRLRLHLKVKNLKEKNGGLLSIYESIKGEIDPSEVDKFIQNNPEYDLSVMEDNYNTKYPLLTHVHVYNYTEVLPAITQYINLIDSI